MITHGDGFHKNNMAAFLGTGLGLCQAIVSTVLMLKYYLRCTRLPRVAEILLVFLIVLPPVATVTMVVLRLIVFKVSWAW